MFEKCFQRSIATILKEHLFSHKIATHNFYVILAYVKFLGPFSGINFLNVLWTALVMENFKAFWLIYGTLRQKCKYL